MEKGLIAKGTTTDINSFTLTINDKPIIVITENEFKYKGELIEDGGEIYKLFKNYLESYQKEVHKQEIKKVWFDSTMQFDNSSKMTNYKSFEDYYQETYGSKGSDECYFEPTTNTSSATICKHCGREKFMHTELQQINQDNPVTRGSTALVPTSCQTEISDAGKDTADYIDRHIIESMKELAREGFKPQVSEISDEEIWKAAESQATFAPSFVRGVEWFREQLKKNL